MGYPVTAALTGLGAVNAGAGAALGTVTNVTAIKGLAEAGGSSAAAMTKGAKS